MLKANNRSPGKIIYHQLPIHFIAVEAREELHQILLKTQILTHQTWCHRCRLNKSPKLICKDASLYILPNHHLKKKSKFLNKSVSTRIMQQINKIQNLLLLTVKRFIKIAYIKLSNQCIHLQRCLVQISTMCKNQKPITWEVGVGIVANKCKFPIPYK